MAPPALAADVTWRDIIPARSAHEEKPQQKQQNSSLQSACWLPLIGWWVGDQKFLALGSRSAPALPQAVHGSVRVTSHYVAASPGCFDCPGPCPPCRKKHVSRSTERRPSSFIWGPSRSVSSLHSPSSFVGFVCYYCGAGSGVRQRAAARVGDVL